MGRNDSSSISAQTTPNFAQPNLIFIVVQFKMNTNYLLLERHNHSIWITLVQHTEWPRALGSFVYCDFFLKQRPSHFSVWVWNGTVCHKLPFPVICQRCSADGESTGLLTDAYLTSHTFRVLYFYVSNSNCDLFSPENGFLYIFLVCQCLGVFFFFVLWNHFDILKFSPFSITFVKTEIHFQCLRKSFCSDLVCCYMKKKIIIKP